MNSTVICGHRYEDATAAIAWLCDVLGFERHAVYEGTAGTIDHAELTLGGGMIMLGSDRQNDFSRLMKQPAEIGGAQTRSAYIVVPEADALYARVKASNAPIEQEIKDEDYGGRGFTCRDPEGHVWSVGTYDPWQTK